MKIDKNYLSTSAFAGVTPVVKRPVPKTNTANTNTAKDAEKTRIDKMMALCRLYGVDTAEIEDLLNKKGIEYVAQAE